MIRTLLNELTTIVADLVGMVAVAVLPRIAAEQRMIRAVRQRGGLPDAVRSVSPLTRDVGGVRLTFQHMVPELLGVLMEIESTKKALTDRVPVQNRPKYPLANWEKLLIAISDRVISAGENGLTIELSHLADTPELWVLYSNRCVHYRQRIPRLIEQLSKEFRRAPIKRR